MRKLILLRHAKAGWNEPGQSDLERHLTGRGENDCLLIGNRLKARGLDHCTTRVLCSPARRTRQTAAHVTRILGGNTDSVVVDQRLYLANPADLMLVLGEQPDSADTLLLVGHNPGLTDMIARLSGKWIAGLQTCGFAELVFDCDRWIELDWGTGRLEHMDWPRNSGGD